ncbi:F-box protein At1g67340 isoform X2 [Spinacia oleracea]|uniref:F-box protein At1g67340 isoform X2 n=1 Tax=Spinacia oleracea TaxID=3562 RepID=A0ABM3QP87_SPIOL|nr:F-box protein At1g67340-like isoform X2 [Spinacia oleracea]
MNLRKKLRVSPDFEEKSEPFEKLPDDLVICILSKLCSSSSSPSHFISALLVCKRFNQLGMNKLVLSNACSKVFDIRARNWSESAHRFLKLCVHGGSIEACYFLGMVRFYCMRDRGGGASLMAKAAIKSHAQALYSLAVIQFNGSGGAKSDRDIRAGIALSARAANFCHVGALRDLAHCLKNGYGIKQNKDKGRRLLFRASVRELSSVLRRVGSHGKIQKRHTTGGFGLGFGSDFLSLLEPNPDPASRFLVEWFKLNEGELGPGLKLCSYSGCGRPETRPYEFRRCSVCGVVNYCSRGCQTLDWKAGHKVECSPVGADQWGDMDPNLDGPDIDHNEVG